MQEDRLWAAGKYTGGLSKTVGAERFNFSGTDDDRAVGHRLSLESRLPKL
jgi:hypothetical protein